MPTQTELCLPVPIQTALSALPGTAGHLPWALSAAEPLVLTVTVEWLSWGGGGSRAVTSHQVPHVVIEDLKRGLAELGCTVSIKGKAHLEGSMRKNKYKTLVIQTADYMLK